MFDAMQLETRSRSNTALDGLWQPESRGTDRLIARPLVNFQSGQRIFTAGDPAGSFYKIAYGMVRVYRILADGRRQIYAFHLPGDIFGLESDDERQFFADAVGKTGLYVACNNTNNDLHSDVLGLALLLLNQAYDHLLALGRQDAVGRVKAFLIEMAERQQSLGDGIVNLPMTRTDIGDYLGLTIETVSRALSKLTRDGVIRQLTPHRIDIVRRDLLCAGCE